MACTSHKNKALCIILVMIITISDINKINGELHIPYNLDWTTYLKPGDLMLGGVFSIKTYNSSQGVCSKKLLGSIQTQFVQAMVYSTNKVNSNSYLLQNISLGFIILDDCTRDHIALARALSFLPQKNGKEYIETLSRDSVKKSNFVPSFDVVGVLGSMISQNSLVMAELLGLFQASINLRN